MRVKKSNIPDRKSLSSIPDNDFLKSRVFQEHLHKQATGNNSSVHNTSNNYLQNSLSGNDVSPTNNTAFENEEIKMNSRLKLGQLVIKQVASVKPPSIAPSVDKGENVTAEENSPPKEDIENFIEAVKGLKKDEFKMVDLTRRLQSKKMIAGAIRRVLDFFVTEGNVFEVIESPRPPHGGRPPGPTYRIRWGKSKYFPDPINP